MFVFLFSVFFVFFFQFIYSIFICFVVLFCAVCFFCLVGFICLFNTHPNKSQSKCTLYTYLGKSKHLWKTTSTIACISPFSVTVTTIDQLN